MEELNIPINYVDFTPEELAERAIWDAERPAKMKALIEDARRIAYQTNADPLFFGWQRGDNTQQEWLDAVEAVKEAYPYPEGV